MANWRIPFPYDYHKEGEIVVLGADTPEEAVAKAREYVEKSDYYDYYLESLATEAIEFADSVYFNSGCDC